MESGTSKKVSKNKRKSSPVLEGKANRSKPEEAKADGFPICEGNSERFEAIGSDDQQDKDVLEERPISAEMESNIREIRQKVEQFGDQASGLLKTVKDYFVEISNVFEVRLAELYQTQIDKWQEEIKMIATIDSENEEMSFRLGNAQELLNSM
ncbi:hypothetical protein KP509_04G074200 [Ceratopteris richardii]|uniref:Uncharacterized protein n=1 Tax=Ceratopteris richardii TaxID=49495 RepID=A0A8T2V1A5_CERRI|nr:hypothetical protein KP509_04G074200 [Ceratopteris richardii]